MGVESQLERMAEVPSSIRRPGSDDCRALPTSTRFASHVTERAASRHRAQAASSAADHLKT